MQKQASCIAMSNPAVVSEVPSADKPNDDMQQQPPQTSAAPQADKSKAKKTYERVEMPSPEQMASQELMNNCAVRTVVSGVMGSMLGVVFGIVMGTMDGAVSEDSAGDVCLQQLQATTTCILCACSYSCIDSYPTDRVL